VADPKHGPKQQGFPSRRPGACTENLYFGRAGDCSLPACSTIQAIVPIVKSAAGQAVAWRLLNSQYDPDCKQGGEDDRQQQNSHRR
jgi:hypothetical protein